MRLNFAKNIETIITPILADTYIMTIIKYQYEVAFSFLKQDEAIAFDLNDKLQDRLSTFIYSKQQEELGGTDGEKKFNQVFHDQTRVVVVLYRDGWGQSPWTRIEETAIKNRAFDGGWEFLLLINLDVNSSLPKWIPKSYIWLDFSRFKAEGAIAVIDQKVLSTGGNVRPESIDDRAERLKRKRVAEDERDIYLKSDDAIRAANTDIELIIDKAKKLESIIEHPASGLRLGMQESTAAPLMYQIAYQGYCLCFNNSQLFDRYLIQGQTRLTGELRVSLYTISGHKPFDYKETIHSTAAYKFDRTLQSINGWVDLKNGEFVTSDELVNKWGKKFMDGIEKRRSRP